MRLSTALFKYRPEFHGYIPKFPGTVETGKHRYVPKVTRLMKIKFWREATEEMATMKYLSNPYITEEQERAYLQSVGKTQPEYADDFLFKKVLVPLKQKYAADLIAPLDRDRKFEQED